MISRAYAIVIEIMSFVTFCNHVVLFLFTYYLLKYLIFLDIEFVEPTSAAASPTVGEAMLVVIYINSWFKCYPEHL